VPSRLATFIHWLLSCWARDQASSGRKNFHVASRGDLIQKS
jgi:hypothetical protein